MNSNQFKIFIQDSRFRFTTNRILYTLLIIFALVDYLFNKLNITSEISELPSMLLGITAFTSFILLIASYFRIQKLHGILTGILEFKNDSIIIDNNIILIESIEQIDFQLTDYIGRRERISRYELNLNAKISVGVNNICDIKTIDGDTHSVCFQRIKSNDIQKVRAELIHYHKVGKITFKRLIHILGNDSYGEIQELKNEISKL